MLYELYNIKKIYNSIIVLSIPKLMIEKGKIYALEGHNGAGKTTLLNILGFLDLPSSGTIIYNHNNVIFKEKLLITLRKEITLVHQNPILFSCSVYKNIEFGLKIRKIEKNKREKIITQSLDMVGMLDFIHRDARSLSGGETQRVVIARALACFPKVILLDEPTASVDSENKAIIENIILNINQQLNISVILCTHNHSQALNLADKYIVLEKGNLFNA